MKYEFQTIIAVENPNDIKEEAKSHFIDPPPGIDPIEVEIVDYKISTAPLLGNSVDSISCDPVSKDSPLADNFYEALITIETTAEEYITNLIQYGIEDPYSILTEVSPIVGLEKTQQLIKWMKTKEFTKAGLSYHPEHGIAITKEPARLDW